MTESKLHTWGNLIIMEGLGIWGYLSSIFGLKSDSSSSSSELWEMLCLVGGDSKQSSSTISFQWQCEDTELEPFSLLALLEEAETWLVVLPDGWCCCSWRPGRTSGWDVTGVVAERFWSSLLCVEKLGSGEDDGSLLPSLGSSKQWPKDEQGNPCMLVDSNRTRTVSKTNWTDISWLRIPDVWTKTEW